MLYTNTNIHTPHIMGLVGAPIMMGGTALTHTRIQRHTYTNMHTHTAPNGASGGTNHDERGQTLCIWVPQQQLPIFVACN